MTVTRSVALRDRVPLYESAQGGHDPMNPETGSAVVDYDETTAAVGQVFHTAIGRIIDAPDLTLKQRLKQIEALLIRWEEVRKAIASGKTIVAELEDELKGATPDVVESRAAAELADDARFLQSRFPVRTPGRWVAEAFMGIFRAPLPHADKVRLLEVVLRSHDRPDAGEPVHIRPCKFDPYATPAACAAALLESSNLQPR